MFYSLSSLEHKHDRIYSWDILDPYTYISKLLKYLGIPRGDE